MNNISINSETIEQLLHNRFCPPAWAFIPQVRSGTGANYDRTADAIAMSLWPYRGLDIHGFEIKIYRGDWLKELKTPEKAEAIARYCDYWWIVAPQDIVKVDEVPHNWGLMKPYGKSVRVVKKAESLKPLNIDKPFLAAILRKAQAVVTSESRLSAATEDGRTHGMKKAEELFEIERREHSNLKEAVERFEKASGVRIKSWSHTPEDIGEAVKMILERKDLRIKERLKALLDVAESIVTNIKRDYESITD